jgi:tryptophanyl-tRNA synthetase
MSKSAGNTIFLSDTPEDIQKKLRTAVTDPQKIRRNDPGRPEVCLVYVYHQRFNGAEAEEIGAGCRAGSLGCVECKKRIADRIAATLTPFRETRAYYDAHSWEIIDVLTDGEQRARTRAEETMTHVRTAMHMG